jgi:hypothetical protein
LLFAKYEFNLNDHVKEDEMGMEGRGMHTGILWESQKGRDHEEDQDVGGLIILKWVLER